MVDRKKIIEIFKASPTPTSIVKADPPNFTFIQVNDAYVQMTQRSESELLGKSLFEAFPENPDEEKPTGVEKLRNSFIKVIDTKSEDEMYGIRYDIILDDGKYKQLYWKVVNTPVLDEKGEVEFIINSATNITEKYRSDLEKKLMLNNSEDSFILIDKNLEILNFNDQFAKNYFDIFNKRIKKGDLILNYAQPERREIVKGIYDRVFEGEIISDQLELPVTDGGSRHFTIKYKPATDDNDEIIGSFISLIEITNEKNAWDQLEEKEARFRALVENGSDILFILNKDGNPTYSSPSVKHILGYTPEEIIEMDLLDKAHPDDVPMIKNEIEKCLDKPGEPIEVPPARLKDKEGKWHWFEGTITNMLHDPAIGGIVDNFKEITERIEAEKEIQQAKEQYQSLVQSVNGIVWESDADTFVFNYVSPQAKSILGYDPEEWIDTPGFWKNKLHPEEREQIVRYCQTETLKGRNHSFEYRMRKANGEYIWLQDVVTVVKENGKPVSLRGLMIDITQEKELQAKLESAYDLAKIGNWELDLQKEKLHWSDYVKKLHEVELDYKPDLESAINFYKEGWSRESITEEVNKTIEIGTPFDVELIIETAKGNERWVRAIGEPEFQNGKCIRIYGSTQDITERKEAELARDNTLYQLAERVKEQQCLYEISQLKEQNLSTDEILEKAVQLIPQGWQFPEITEACITWKGKTFTTKNYQKTEWEIDKTFDLNIDHKLEISLIYLSNKPFGNAPPFLNEEYDLLNAIGKQIATKLQQIINRNEKEFERLNKQALINSTQDLIWSITPNMKLITGNQGFIDTLEFQTGQSVKTGQSVFKGIATDSDYVQLWNQYYNRALEGETLTIENKEVHPKDNSEIWYEITFNPILKGKNITGVACYARNITETKRAQLEKEEAEKKYRNVVEHSTNMFYQHDTEGVLNYVSPQSQEFLGYPPEEAKRNWTEYITDHPINEEGEKHTLKAIKTGKVQPPYELQLKTSDERIIWVEVHEAPLIEDGEVTGIVGSLTDITERKEYEEQLRESLERYDYVSKATRDAIYDWDIKNNSLHWGEGFENLFGYEPVEDKFTIKKYHQSVHPEDREEAFNDLKFTLNDSSMDKWSFEYRFQKADGNYAYVIENGYIIRNEDGEATRMIGALRDITDKKIAEQEIIEANTKLKTAQKIAHLGYWELDLEENKIYWSDEVYRIWGVKPEGGALEYDEFRKTIHPDDLEMFDHHQEKALSGKQDLDLEHRIILKDGTIKWVHKIGSLIKNRDGDPEKFEGTVQDITNQKNAELELQKAYQEKENILESIADGFFTLDENWNVTYWNKAAERLLHTPKHKVLHENLWDIFDDATGLPSYTNYHRVMHERNSVSFEDYYEPIDKWFDINAYPSDDGISVFFKDITEQKRIEKEIKESLTEKETLLAEIHHRVKNNLAVVSGMMQLQAYESENENLKSKLFDSVVRIKTMASVHELLYQSNSFSELEFSDTLTKLAKNVSQTLQPKEKITLNLHCDPLTLNINQAIPASLIVNEVITNAYKHAFKGIEQGIISFSLTEQNNYIKIRIKDNGVGFNDIDPLQSGSLGMHLISVLTDQIQGSFDYKSEIKGTCFTLKFKRMKAKKGIGKGLLD